MGVEWRPSGNSHDIGKGCLRRVGLAHEVNRE
jgi:hypothetical protein